MSETGPRRRLELDWVRVVAGALAAVSSAVLLSTLGAAGTLVGAALGSVIVSITTSVYGTGLARGTEKVAEAQTVALRKVGTATESIAQVRRAQTEMPTDAPADATDDAPDDAAEVSGEGAVPPTDTSPADQEAVLAEAEQQLAEAAAELEQAAEPTTDDRLSIRERLAAVPWKRVGIAAAGMFAVAMLLLTSFEVIGGRSISSYTGGSDGDGGTSIGGVLGGRGGGAGDDVDPEQPPGPVDDDPATRSPNPGGPASDPASPTEDPDDPSETEPTGDPGQSSTSEEPTEDEPSDPPTTRPTPTTPTSPTSPTTP